MLKVLHSVGIGRGPTRYLETSGGPRHMYKAARLWVWSLHIHHDKFFKEVGGRKLAKSSGTVTLPLPDGLEHTSAHSITPVVVSAVRIISKAR